MRTEDIVRAAAEERRERIAEHDPEPVRQDLRRLEPVDTVVEEKPLPPAVAELYSSRTESAPTTVSGPSFLGLSGGSEGSGYSYLYEDEQPSSHAGAIVFLLVLAVLAGVLYWKWDPIRTYVVNAAMTHSKSDKPAAPTEGTAGSATASSDNASPQPGQATNPNGLPQQDNANTSEQPKGDAAQPKTDGAQPKDAAPDPNATKPDKTSAPKEERPQSEVGRTSRFQNVKGNNGAASEEDSTEDNEKPARRTPAQPAGAELVSSGEKYLYGRGAPRSCEQALTYFNAAAKQENPRAMSHLGSLYATGECVPLDRAQAYQWFSRALAADRNNSYIEHDLNMLWRDMSSEERAKATQKKMF